MKTKTSNFKTVLLVMTLSIVTSISAFANENYNQAMAAALNQFGTSENIADFQETANSFNRISNLTTKEWLPNYYQAQCYILMSFMEKENAQKDAYLDLAENALNAIIKIEPENSEVLALQAFMYTGRIVIDPMTRGREYSILSNQSLQKALIINPNNPRALYLQLTNEIGMAQFFGTDTSIFCERITSLNNKWDELNQTEGMNPSWGKGQAQGLNRNCSE